MSMINQFIRKGSKVTVDINTNLNVSQPVYLWSWECQGENYAELLTIKLNQSLEEYKHGIAKNALSYLSNEEKSEMKRSLVNWNGKKHCWK